MLIVLACFLLNWANRQELKSRKNMSALANNFKKNFAGLLRGLLRKVDNGDYAESQQEHRSLLRQPGSAPQSAAQAAAAAELQSVPGDPRLQSFPDQVTYGAAPSRAQTVQELEM